MDSKTTKEEPGEKAWWKFSFSDRKVNVVGTVKDIDTVKLTDPNSRIGGK